MKKFSKTECKSLDGLLETLRNEEEALELAVTAYNEAVADAFADLSAVVSSYNEALQNVAEFRDEATSTMQNYFDEKSEKWQDGDAGQAFTAWKEEWEIIMLDDLELEQPDELTCQPETTVEYLENLPRGVE